MRIDLIPIPQTKVIFILPLILPAIIHHCEWLVVVFGSERNHAGNIGKKVIRTIVAKIRFDSQILCILRIQEDLPEKSEKR